MLNPKTALFFVAFLPQFVDPDEPVRLQLALLGGIFVILALASDSAWALIAGTASGVLRRSSGFARIQRWVSGTIYLSLGALTALAGPRHGS